MVDLEETDFKALVYNDKFVGSRLFFDDGTVGDLDESAFKSVFTNVNIACFDGVLKLEDFNGELMTRSEYRSKHSVKDMSKDADLIKNLKLAFKGLESTMFELTETVKFIRAEELAKKLNDVGGFRNEKGFHVYNIVMNWDYYNELVDKNKLEVDSIYSINSKIKVFYDYNKKTWKYTDSASF